MSDTGPRPPKDEITPEPLFLRRREFLKDSILFTATSVGVGLGLTSLLKGGRSEPAPSAAAEAPAAPGLEIAGRSALSTTEPLDLYPD